MSGFLGSLPNAKESTAFALLSFFLYWLQKLAAYSQIWKVRNKPFKILNTSQFSVLTFFRFSSQFSTACLKLLFASVFRGIPCHPSSKPRLLLSPFRSQSPLFLHISVSDSQVWEPVYFVFIIRSFVFFSGMCVWTPKTMRQRKHVRERQRAQTHYCLHCLQHWGAFSMPDSLRCHSPKRRLPPAATANGISLITF